MDSIKIERADVSENGALNDVTGHTKLKDIEEMESCSLVDKAHNAPSIDESDPKNNQFSDDNIDHGDTDLVTKIVKDLESIAEEQLSDLNHSDGGTEKQASVQECVVVGTQCDEENEDLSENRDSKKNVVYDLQNKCGHDEERKTQKHKPPMPEKGSRRFKNPENEAIRKFFEKGTRDSNEESTPLVKNDIDAVQNASKENSKGSPASDKIIQNQWSFVGLKKRQFIICVIMNLVGIFICSTVTGIIVSILINKNCEDTCIRMSEQKQSATPPWTHFDSIELLIWNDTAFVAFSSGKYNITRVIYDNKKDIAFCKKTNTIVCGKTDTADCELVPEDKIYSSVKKVTYQVDMQCVNKSYSLIWTRNEINGNS